MTKPSSSLGVLSWTSYSNLLPLIKSTYILSCNARKTSVFLSTLQNPKPAEIHCTYKTSPKLGLDSTFGLGLKFRCFRGTKTSAICQANSKRNHFDTTLQIQDCRDHCTCKFLQLILEQFSSNLLTPAYKFRDSRDSLYW